MLNLMRKHAGSWMIKVILFAIVVVFVFWGVGSFTSRNQTQVADVNGEVISLDAYHQAYYQLLDNYRRVYGDQLNDNLLKMLRPGEQALDQLISRILLLQESDRLNIEVNDQELKDAIQAMPAFQNNGVFDFKRYQQLLNFNKMSVEQFEKSERQDLRIGKLQSLVINGVHVSDEEARQWFDWNNAQVNVEYLVFEPKQYDDVVPSQEQIEKYFKENTLKYKTEPQVKVRYLHFDPDAYQQDVQVGDEEIADYYQLHTDEFKTEKTVEARHILFKVNPDSDEAAVQEARAKAINVAKMAKAGQDFAQLAKQYSEGPTRDKGGHLGAFKRNAMVKPFADAAFSMGPGDISDPVRTRFGWHVIKVEKINPATTQDLEEATPKIRKRIIEERARQKALEAAEQAYDSVFDGDDLKDADQSGRVPVRVTSFFTSGGLKDNNIRNTKQFATIAFGLEPMAISEIQDWDDGYYLLQVVEKIPSTEPELDAVIDSVRKDVISAQQSERARTDAEALLAELKKGDSLADASRRRNLEPKETGFFKRTGQIDSIGFEQRISQIAFELSMEQPVADQVVEGRKGWYVLRLKERKLPPREDYVKARTATLQRLTEQRKQAVFQSWVADLRERGVIDINQELVQRQ
jgi:peptidyl-prolyl cis-trans isomerase D